MTPFKPLTLQPDHLSEPALGPILTYRSEQSSLEAHLQALQERLAASERSGGSALERAELYLQIARTLVSLGRGAEAWPLARSAFDQFMAWDQFESAADACDVLFQADQPGSLAALGQGIWLAVTCPIDLELTLALLRHVIDETPPHADGAAVAATAALFLVDLRAQGRERENLLFFATQMLAQVAQRHSQVETQEELDLWMERLELKEPDRFLPRLRHIVDVLVGDDWWFDRAALQRRLPMHERCGDVLA